MATALENKIAQNTDALIGLAIKAYKTGNDEQAGPLGNYVAARFDEITSADAASAKRAGRAPLSREEIFDKILKEETTGEGRLKKKLLLASNGEFKEERQPDVKDGIGLFSDFQSGNWLSMIAQLSGFNFIMDYVKAGFGYMFGGEANKGKDFTTLLQETRLARHVDKITGGDTQKVLQSLSADPAAVKAQAESQKAEMRTPVPLPVDSPPVKESVEPDPAKPRDRVLRVDGSPEEQDTSKGTCSTKECPDEKVVVLGQQYKNGQFKNMPVQGSGSGGLGNIPPVAGVNEGTQLS